MIRWTIIIWIWLLKWFGNGQNCHCSQSVTVTVSLEAGGPLSNTLDPIFTFCSILHRGREVQNPFASVSTFILTELFMIRYLIRWVENDSLVGEDGSFNNWRPGEPDGGESYNCMYFVKEDGRWFDATCDYTLPAVCSKRISTTRT